MKKIKDRTLWCIGNNRLLNQKGYYGVDYYDGFMYSECGHIILGVSNGECGECSDLYVCMSDNMVVDISYTVGLLKKFGK